LFFSLKKKKNEGYKGHAKVMMHLFSGGFGMAEQASRCVSHQLTTEWTRRTFDWVLRKNPQARTSKVGIEPASPIGIATNKHKTLSQQREPAIIATMQSTDPRQASQMAWSPEAQSAIASGFDSDVSTQSIASTLSSSSRPASPIATFQIPPSHPFI
jgi:hypothetical protein